MPALFGEHGTEWSDAAQAAHILETQGISKIVTWQRNCAHLWIL